MSIVPLNSGILMNFHELTVVSRATPPIDRGCGPRDYVLCKQLHMLAADYLESVKIDVVGAMEVM